MTRVKYFSLQSALWLILIIGAGCPNDSLKQGEKLKQSEKNAFRLKPNEIAPALEKNLAISLSAVGNELSALGKSNFFDAIQTSGLASSVPYIGSMLQPPVDGAEEADTFMSPEALSGLLQMFFQHPLMANILSKDNILSQTADGIVYGVSKSFCSDVAQLAPNSVSDQVATHCEKLLDKISFQLKISSFEGEGLTMAISINEIDKSDPQELFSLSAGPGTLAFRGNLALVRTLAVGVAEVVSNDKANEILSSIEKLDGVISSTMHFGNDSKPSQCKNQERICFLTNIDKDVELKIANLMEASLSWAASPKDNPTFYFSTKDNDNVELALNSGKLDVSYQDKSIHFDKISGTITFPTKDNDNAVLVLENIDIGKPSLSFGPAKISIDLASDSSSKLKKARIWFEQNNPIFELSQLDLIIDILYSPDESSKAFSNIKVSFKPDGENNTILHLGRESNPGASAPGIEDSSSPDNPMSMEKLVSEFFDDPSAMLNMLSTLAPYLKDIPTTTDPQPLTNLWVDQGSLEMSLECGPIDGEDWEISSGSLEIMAGHCLDMSFLEAMRPPQ